MPQASLLLLGARAFPGVCTVGRKELVCSKHLVVVGLCAQGSEEGSAGSWEGLGLKFSL